jgi:hypothetical protein
MPEKIIRASKEGGEHHRVKRSLKTKLQDYLRGIPGKRKGNCRTDVSVFEKIHGKRVLIAIHEVETETRINPAEAKAEWLPYSKQGVDFYLYVPKGNCDLAMFLCVTGSNIKGVK